MVIGLRQPCLHHLEILAALFLLRVVELHYGIKEQGQLAFHPIVAEWR